jgi:hypothetical protein
MTEETFLFRGFTRLEQLKHLIATQQIDADFYWRRAVRRPWPLPVTVISERDLSWPAFKAGASVPPIS